MHESTTAEFELMTVNDNAVKQRKISASVFDTEYKSRESKKMMEKHEQLEQETLTKEAEIKQLDQQIQQRIEREKELTYASQ